MKVEKSFDLDAEAQRTLDQIMDALRNEIVDGASKIREYAGKQKIDADAIRIAAYMDTRLKKEVFKK